MHTVGDSSKEQVWIFGFGSLIWKAGELSHFPVQLRADPSTEMCQRDPFNQDSHMCHASLGCSGFDYSQRVEGYIKDYRCSALILYSQHLQRQENPWRL